LQLAPRGTIDLVVFAINGESGTIVLAHRADGLWIHDRLAIVGKRLRSHFLHGACEVHRYTNRTFPPEERSARESHYHPDETEAQREMTPPRPARLRRTARTLRRWRWTSSPA
jgi:hypothetical protein